MQLFYLLSSELAQKSFFVTLKGKIKNLEGKVLKGRFLKYLNEELIIKEKDFKFDIGIKAL